jgi:hypothetical protein
MSKYAVHVGHIFSENLAIYRTITKNTADSDRQQLIEHNMAERQVDLHAG